jgi:hypothetical protein
LYVPVPPARVFDSRDGIMAMRRRTLPADRRHDIAIAGRAGIPCDGVGGAVVNLTGTETDAPGYATLWPTGTTRPGTSSLNLSGADATRANLAIVPTGLWGQTSALAQRPTALILDVSGYFLGTDQRPQPGVTTTPDHRADEGLPPTPPCYVDPYDIPPAFAARPTCADFLFQDAAEGYERAHPDPTSLLDADHDGLVCEGLPRAVPGALLP